MAHLLATAMLILLFSTSGCDRSPSTLVTGENLGPLLRFDENPSTNMDGAWRSRGYGWIFDIRDSEVTQYQVAGSHCFATPEIGGELSETLALDYEYYRVGSDLDTAVLQLLPDDTEIRVDRISELPEACRQESDHTYAELLDYFSTMMAEHYAFFERRNINWEERVAAARNRVAMIENDQEFFELLARMIDEFSDSHTKLRAEIDGEILRQQDGLGPTLSRVRDGDEETPWMIGLFSGLQQEVLDPGSHHTARDRILWGTIGGEVGYVQILVMGGFSGLSIGDPRFREEEFKIFDEVMDEALSAMQDVDFVVLDLSNNRGGYDAISRRLVSRFAADSVIAYQTEVPRSTVPARPRIVEPAEGPRYVGPVLLLTSDVTVSGGELATLGLKALPNVTHMGGTTRGSFSTVLAKPLPNGWVVELSNEIISSADGSVYEEIGIAPEFEYDMFPVGDSVDGYFKALHSAVDRMRNILDI